MSSDTHKQLFKKINPPTKLFINNEWVDSEDKSTFEVIDPTTEEVICKISHAKQADVDKAVSAANKAFPSWSTKDPLQRASLLNKLADLIEKNASLLGELEALNNGKCKCAAIGYDISQSANVFRYYAGWCDKLPLGEIVPSENGFQVLVTRQPIGIVGAIVPWNFPFMLTAWKIAPALCCGCTVVIKPSEVTPLTGLYLGLLLVEAGFPPGVVNIVPGFGNTSGEAITSHKDIEKVTFTGSTVTGKKVMVSAANSNLKKVTLELGGKSPNVVFDDCNFEEAVDGAAQALFLNMGQNCCAGSRLFVQESIYEKFLASLKQRVSNIVVGDPLDENVNKAGESGKIVNGPLVNKLQFEKVLGYINKGKSEGAKLLIGGDRKGNRGYFIQPTVFYDVTDDMTIAKEEIFGPVLSVLKFKTLDEAVERANKTVYGLAAAVWTTDLKKIHEFMQRVKSGVVWANTYNIVKYNAPFGGVKATGFGRDLGLSLIHI
eukprot:TRINITY_DN6280_c0_g1_i1.p1 TRINITY_DN6280_c0_g1~~TRINITY_DN6280_c0_g1_i1.p1  ORF type:complete len:489 (-),score=88.85 TRINITY_DN6280_c0_g1_i1:19-1485(-)